LLWHGITKVRFFLLIGEYGYKRCYNKALEIKPNYVNASYNKGLALYSLGKHNEAIELYDKSLDIDPNDVDALNSKGISLGELGRYYEAIELYG
jgi:tetratricopeptide (TPR) repeat protein